MIDQTALAAARRDARKRYGIRLVSVEGEPISLADAWAHLRLEPDGSPEGTDHDAWLTSVGIPGARDYCEHYIGASIAPQTLELATNGFPTGFIPLPFGPILSVVSVTFLDPDASPPQYSTMDTADYQLNAYVLPTRLELAYGASWPTAVDFDGSVKVQYTAGYSLPDDSPQVNVLPYGIKAAMLLMLGHLFENREATAQSTATSSLVEELPLGVAALLERYRLRLSMA